MDDTDQDNTEIFDDLLNLEEKFYDEGYEAGSADGKQAGFLEGKQFGIQTGFQRFLSIGILQGRLNVWKPVLSENASLRNEKHIQQMESYLSGLPKSNSDDNVEKVNKSFKRAKAKAKVLQALTKDQNPLNLHEDALDLKQTEETIEGD